MMQRPWFIFAGGGTGGHLYPAMAVVEALRGMAPETDVSFFCTDRPMDRDILGGAGIEAIPQGVLPFPAKPWAWPKFLVRWRQSVRFCEQRFVQRRPAFVVGAGGYASGPPVHAAARLGIPTFLLNPDAVPGRANRHMAKRAGVRGVFAQWDVTRRHFPPSVAVEVCGCPVRPAFRQSVGQPAGPIRESFGLDPDIPTLLVTGASQGARTINEAMLLLLWAVAAVRWQVLHLAGAADAGHVEQRYRAFGSGLKFRVLAFTDRMAEAMTSADLVISRAGASTLSEIQAVGKPSILFPYPYHRDQHQRHNAVVLAEAGAAVLLDDLKDATANASQLGVVLARLMGDAECRSQMAQAARELDRPQSAQDIAARLLAATNHAENPTL